MAALIALRAGDRALALAVKDGYAGTIRTLTMSVRVRLVANDRKEAEGAPDFRILAGAAEIGAAWRRTRKGPTSPTSA